MLSAVDAGTCMQRKASWSTGSPNGWSTEQGIAKRLNSSMKDQAQRNWAAKQDQVRSSQAQLSRCTNDHEDALEQQAKLAQQIVMLEHRRNQVT